MNRIPNWLKWLVVALVFALMGAAVLAVGRPPDRRGLPPGWICPTRTTPSASTARQTPDPRYAA